MRFLIADCCGAFKQEGIGSKVVDDRFFDHLYAAVQRHDTSQDKVPGQMLVDLNTEECQYVRAGVGYRTVKPEDYVLREHRGRVQAFLKRSFALPATGAQVVVYTRQAYLADPDTQGDAQETARVLATNAPYIIVAVLGYCKRKSPLTPKAFAHNLGGGNHEAQKWNADTIRGLAREIDEYDEEFCVVSD